MKYTHTAWFGLCPIYIGNLDKDMPDIKPRRPWLMPWLRLQIAWREWVINTCVAINPQWRPHWKILITGELK